MRTKYNMSRDIRSSFRPSDSIQMDTEVQFALSGPLMGSDQLLAHSPNVPLEIIGNLAHPFEKFRERDDSIFSLNVQIIKTIELVFFPSNKTHMVFSNYVNDIDKASDGRSSRLGFAWIGHANLLDIKKIEKIFEMQAPEIINSIKEHNENNLKWSMSPVLLECKKSQESAQSKRRFGIFIMLIYVLLILSIPVFSMLKGFFLK